MCVLGTVVLGVISCTRDGESDMNSSMSKIEFIFFFIVFLIAWETACHSVVFGCLVNDLQRLFTINTLTYI